MKKEILYIAAILFGITLIFFYQTALFGKVPFPADGLVSDFQPWRSASYLGYAAGGIPNKAQYPDTYRQIYPWKTLVISELKQGKLPLWNPYNFSGSPLLANFQSAALYPIGILYLFINQIAAWTILVILQPLLACLFTYFYARKIGAKPYGAVLAAVSYGFSGFMAVWLEYNTVGHVIIWLPLILLSIESLRKRRTPVWLAILALSNTSALLAGHPQVYGYMLIFSIAYGICRLPRPQWLSTALCIAYGIGASGIQLVPGIELIQNAARSPHEFTNLFTKILIQPWQYIAMVFPNIFGNPATRTYWPDDTFVGKVTTIGLVPLFFLFSALRRKDAPNRWHLWAALMVAILISANPVTYILYRLPIPIISASSPTLMTFLLTFSLSIICGLGLDYWMTDKHSLKKLYIRSAEVLGLCLAIILLAKLPYLIDFHTHAAVVIRAVVYGAIIASITLGLFWVAIAFPKVRRLTIIVLLIVHTADLWMFFTRFNPFVPAGLVFPSHPIISFLSSHGPDRYWGYGTANIAANFATQYRMFSPEGYDPLYPKWYGQYLYSYRTGSLMKTFDNATRSDAAITSGFGDGGLSDLKKQNILNALSVRYILDRTENGSTEEIFPPSIFKNIYSDTDWRIYENLNASPRAYMSPAPASSSATIVSYTPEHVIIRTKNSKQADLVLTDTYYPGWIATIDGKFGTIERYNYAFRKVTVPKGDHTVIMTYKPISVALGKLVSIISILGLLATLIIIKRKNA